MWDWGAPEDEHGKKVVRVFWKTFVATEVIMILVWLSSGQPFTVGGVGFVTGFALFVAFLGSVIAGLDRRGNQIIDIIEAKHKETKESKSGD